MFEIHDMHIGNLVSIVCFPSQQLKGLINRTFK